MKKFSIIFILLFFFNSSWASRKDSIAIAAIKDSIAIINNALNISINKDSTAIKEMESRIDQLDKLLKKGRQDELNYEFEKKLLKETYRNNYEKISLLLVILLAVLSVLAFFGIKEIKSIRKEYKADLTKLKQIQSDVVSIHKELQINKQELQTNKEEYKIKLQDVIKTNEEQINKKKIIELKDKIEKLIEEKNYISALESCISALQLSPEDIGLLYNKTKIYTRTKNYKDSISIYKKIIELDKENKSVIFDLAGVYLMNKQRIEYNELVAKHADLFNEKQNEKILNLFLILINYQDKQIENLKEITSATIDKTDFLTTKKRIEEWDLRNMLIYFASEPNSKEKIILQNLLWYLDGQLSANEFSIRTNIAIHLTKL